MGKLQPCALRVSIDYEIDQSFWNKNIKRPREKGGREHARNKNMAGEASTLDVSARRFYIIKRNEFVL